MEGFLFKKGSGEEIFGRRNWKKRWFILEGNYLTYYEDFDNVTGKPVNKKGVIVVSDCTINVLTDKKNAFQLVHPERRSFSMQAESDRVMRIWITALEASSSGKLGHGVMDFKPYYDLLELDIEDNPTASQINRAYRKLALKVHPDKGGDILEFKKIQEAVEILTSKLEEDEKEKLYETIYITARITKGPPGVGFGLVVIEDTKKGIVFVKEVAPTVQIVSISENSGGKLKRNDRIMNIGIDDVSTWTMSRIVQRLSEFRVPSGSDVQIRFARKVRIDGQEEDPEAEAAEEEAREAAAAAYQQASYVPEAGDMRHDDDHRPFDDIDEDSREYPDERSMEEETTPVIIPTFSEREDTTKVQHEYNIKTALKRPSTLEETKKKSVRINVSSDLPLVDSKDAEEEKRGLHDEIRELKKLLLQSNEERNKYQEEASKLKDRVKILEEENTRLSTTVDEESTRTKYLELQMQQTVVYNEVSQEEILKSIQDATKISSIIKSGRPIPITVDMMEYLSTIDLSSGGEDNDPEVIGSRRMAVQAVAALDSSGSLLKKWSLSGAGVVERLSRLEDRFSKLDLAQ